MSSLRQKIREVIEKSRTINEEEIPGEMNLSEYLIELISGLSVMRENIDYLEDIYLVNYKNSDGDGEVSTNGKNSICELQFKKIKGNIGSLSSSLLSLEEMLPEEMQQEVLDL